MKNRDLKRALKAAYAAPTPARKAEFLRGCTAPGISHFEFLRIQLRYIQPLPILLSAAIFAAALLLCGRIDADALWLLSSIAPFPALAVLCGSRSYRNGMAELEFATRFSLKSVILARMGILAALHGTLLLVSLGCLGRIGVPLLHAELHLLLPYCTTVCIALPLSRRFHHRFPGAVGAAAAAIVFVLVITLKSNPLPTSLSSVFLLLGAELIIIGIESIRLIQQTEELTWNYS